MDEQLEAIRAWMTSAEEKLVVAQTLFDLSYYDDATSRAYYAILYAARAALLSIGIEPKSHSGVLNQFSQHFVKRGQIDKLYGRMFAIAMQAREASDYSPQLSVSQANAEEIITDAKAFVAKIREVLGDKLG